MRLDVDDAEGEQFRLAAAAEDLPLDAWATRVLRREARRVLHVPEPGILVSALVDAFGERYNDPGLKDAAAYRYDARLLLAHVMEHVLPDGRKLGDLDCELVTRLDVTGLRDALLKSKSGQTCNHVLNRLGRAYVWGKEQGLVRRDDNPVRGVKRPKPYDLTAPLKPEQFYLASEIRTLLDYADRAAPEWAAFYAVAVYTGMRLSEIRRLLWPDLDLERCQVFVRARKNGCNLPVPLNDELVIRLRVWRARVGGKGLVFRSTRGGEWNKRWVEKRWLKAVAGAGVKAIRFHDLRHTAASLWAAENVPLDKVAKFLGQKRLEVTRRYEHLTPEYLRELVNRVRLYGNRPGLKAVRKDAEQNRDREAV